MRHAVFIAALSLATTVANAVTCDFENGLPEGWTLSTYDSRTIPSAELEKNGDNTVLELGKNALMTIGNEERLNFSLEATVRREYDMSGSHVGFQFRNGYRAYVRKPGRIELSGPDRATGRGFSRNMSTFTPLTFKIVVVGPVVRFFVNGQYEGQFDGLAMTPGPVALYQKGLDHNVYFDDVRLETALEPAQFLVCEPETGPDKALVFDPAGDVTLSFKVTNHAAADQRGKLGIDVATFDDKPIFSKQAPPKMIPAGATQTMQVDLGSVPEGFYRLTFMPSGKTVPLAVHARGTVTSDQITTPGILTGVYWYYFGWQGLPEVWWNTYVHAACNDLRRHNFNTIICAIGMPTESIEIASQYGIRCFVRGEGAGKNVSHPNVIGGFIGDEPHKGDEERYVKDYTRLLKEYPDKVWTTCMIGDGGVGDCQPWWDSWVGLSGDGRVARMFRWYGIKRNSIGIKRRYGTLPPLEEILRDMRAESSPYYFIMPSFGDETNVDAYYANPLPSQIRCMMHLAAAFEAKGFFFWTYQTPFPKHTAFVDPVSLLPTDDKWAAAGETAGCIIRNAGVLAECRWHGRYLYVDGPGLLECFELRRKGDEGKYLYVINKDTENAVNGRIYGFRTQDTLRDLFHDRDVAMVETEIPTMRQGLARTSGAVTISLAPGDGVLLRWTVAGGAGEGAEETAMPRVTYPPTVANAPTDRIVWLADLKPVEMPHPGWIPQIKFKGKTWYPDYNSNDVMMYSGPDDAGQLYEKSLWAHAETTIKYDLPAGATTFAAAAGFANKDEKSSAVFRVLVDGRETFNSGVMRLGTPVTPVVVDVTAAKRLELITEEAGDGLYGDYTFWGEARLLK